MNEERKGDRDEGMKEWIHEIMKGGSKKAKEKKGKLEK